MVLEVPFAGRNPPTLSDERARRKKRIKSLKIKKKVEIIEVSFSNVHYDYYVRS